MKKTVFVALLIAIPVLGFKSKEGLRTFGLKFVAPTVFGKENVTNPEPGEIIFDTSDSTFYGFNLAGAPVQLSGTTSGDGVPTGTILPFAGTTPPPGYLMANGQALSKAQ